MTVHMDYIRMNNFGILGYRHYFVTISACSRTTPTSYGIKHLEVIKEKITSAAKGWFTHHTYETGGKNEKLHFHGILYCPLDFRYAPHVTHRYKGHTFHVDFRHIMKPRHYNNILEYMTKEKSPIELLMKRYNVLHLMRTNKAFQYP